MTDKMWTGNSEVLAMFSTYDIKMLSNLTHLPLVLHICSIGSDNGLSPIQRQAIIWTNAGLLSIRPLRTNFSEILIKIQNFSVPKMHLKISSANDGNFVQGEMR